MSACNKFKMISSRACNEDVICGWTKEDFKALPSDSQDWLAQYFMEATGSIGSHSQRQILSEDQLRAAWRDQKARLASQEYQVGHLEAYEWEELSIDTEAVYSSNSRSRKRRKSKKAKTLENV
jgi:hypothetical protein